MAVESIKSGNIRSFSVQRTCLAELLYHVTLFLVDQLEAEYLPSAAEAGAA